MLPFHMLAALPTHPSPRLDPFVPLFSSLFFLTSATSALKSPRSPIAEFHPVAQPPSHFPLFPHPVNIAHAETPATPSPSIVYFTTSVYPGGWGLRALSRASFSLHAMSRSCSCPVRNPFRRNAYKKAGAPPCQPCTALPRYSLLTTHYSPSPTIRYTIPSRHT
jgi:hypothetical protein